MRWLAIGLAAVGATVAASPAAAASYSFSYGVGGTTTAFGTITTDSTVVQPGAANVTNITGFRSGALISGFDYYSDFGDQLIFPNSTSAPVDGSGITYQVGIYSYNVHSAGNGFFQEFRYLTADSSQPGVGTFLTSFTLAPIASGGGGSTGAAVPEPASWAMAMLGIGLSGVALRRRRRPSTRVVFAS